MAELRILSPTAILGYGFPRSSFQRGLDLDPDVIAVDAGSSDPGPYYLGAGISFTDEAAVKRDLEIILLAARSRQIPLLIGTAGGSGAAPHLQGCLNILQGIAAEHNLHFKLAVIPADISKEVLYQALEEERLQPLGPVAPATKDHIVSSTNIVGQMGTGPLVEALKGGAEVIVAGRCYDPAVFAAFPFYKGFDSGLAVHLGKILECAAIAALPGSGSDCMFGYLYADHFVLEALSPERCCTVTSVAAHTLYEKTDPMILPGPDGALSLEQTEFESIDAHRVKVTGSRFIKNEKAGIKIEGARPVGYRTISIAGARDPGFLANLEVILSGVKRRTADNFGDLAATNSYRLLFNIYGRDGVMGEREPLRKQIGHEIGVIIEAIAPTQEMANTICSFARSTMLHYGFSGRLCTAGNLAFPYSPSDFQGGTVFEFSLHHLLEGEDERKLFPIKWEEI